MRIWLAPAGLALAIAAPVPVCAATFVLLPSPGSMSPPRIVSDSSGSDDVYVCSAPSDLHGRRCSLQRSAPARRHG
ncbi:MAG: hypothetical protein JWO25_3307 [Alphaproteobacteria bacterium]|nr:hypothetical protein [Alphaproteobacteria bacterium]MDB5722205.1 hypothetical protein [Alphaproteobacteria bacterium]